ncbi:MAG TPA: hypothetical protein VG097_12300, partial [Gemmata sp.]|nr:hypothetical protein [Gemmata sp.]
QLTFEGLWPTSVAFLGSGQRLAAANQLGKIFIWDLPDKPPAFKAEPKAERQAPNVWPVRQLSGHTNEVSRLVATPDGKVLASASFDRTVRIWPVGGSASGKAEVILDEETRKRESRRSGKKDLPPPSGITVENQTDCVVLSDHKEWIYALGISRDGKRLISGDSSSQVIVWDVAARNAVAKWTGLPWNWIVAASLSPNGETALVSEYRYKRDDFDIPSPALKLWSVATGKETRDLLKLELPKFNEKERTYGSAQIWRKFVANGLISTAFSPDGKYLAAVQGGETETGKVHIFDADSGKLLRTVAGHLNGATDALFSSDGKYIFSTGRDTCVRICQVADGKEVGVLNTPRGGQFKDWFISMTLSPDEKFLAAADIAGLIHVWAFED